MATRNGSAEWKGDLKGGSGTVTVGDDVYTAAFDFTSRFEDGQGTNPEELISAALAACYSMQLSAMLAADGHEPESVRTSARAQLRQVDGRPTIAEIVVETTGDVPGIDDDTFRQTAEKAKAECLIARALAGVGEIRLTAALAT